MIGPIVLGSLMCLVFLGTAFAFRMRPKQCLGTIAILALPLCLILLFLAKGGYFRTKASAISIVHQIGPQKLRNDAQELTIRLKTVEYHLYVPEELWPESFKALRPLNVVDNSQGFTIQRYKMWEDGSGIIVIPSDSNVEFREGKFSENYLPYSYEKLADGVYWYTNEAN